MAFRILNTILPTELVDADGGSGADVRFIGRVRNENRGRPVTSLQYESFSDLAIREGELVLEEARQKFGLSAAECVHRIGHLQVGEDAIVVEVSSPHRKAAFGGCDWIVDQVKLRVPIWKKEFYESGESEWLDPTSGTGPQDMDVPLKT